MVCCWPCPSWTAPWLPQPPRLRSPGEDPLATHLSGLGCRGKLGALCWVQPSPWTDARTRVLQDEIPIKSPHGRTCRLCPQGVRSPPAHPSGMFCAGTSGTRSSLFRAESAGVPAVFGILSANQLEGDAAQGLAVQGDVAGHSGFPRAGRVQLLGGVSKVPGHRVCWQPRRPVARAATCSRSPPSAGHAGLTEWRSPGRWKARGAGVLASAGCPWRRLSFSHRTRCLCV